MNSYANAIISNLSKVWGKTTELSTIILVDLGVGITKSTVQVAALGPQAVDGVLHIVNSNSESNLTDATLSLTKNIKKSAVELTYSDKLIKKQYGSRDNIPTDLTLPAEDPNVKAMTFYDKLINFLKRVLSKIETSLFYLGIACLTLVTIFMLLVVMSGSGLDIFLKGISDAFSATYGLVFELFTQSISGLLRLDFDKLRIVFNKAFSKFNNTIDEINERFNKHGLSHMLYMITAISLVGMVCVMYAILKGKSNNGTD